MPFQFNPIEFHSITSISTHLNWIKVQLNSKQIQIKINFTPLRINLTSIQFNWTQNQIRHQFWSFHVDIKTISFQLANSISKQFDSLRFDFNFNSQHFNSLWWKWIIWGLEGYPPYGKPKITISLYLYSKTNDFSPAARSRFFWFVRYSQKNKHF